MPVDAVNLFHSVDRGIARAIAALWAAWRMRESQTLRLVLGLNIAMFIVLGAMMAGAIRVDLAAYGGLLQKLLALSPYQSHLSDQ
jgi:hypothetical protein